MKRIILAILMVCNIMLAEDKGIGLMFFSEHGPYSSSFQTDSMLIYEDQSELSKVLAKFLLIVSADHNGYRYSVKQPFSVGAPNIVE
jgi:hypothetical protein